VLIGDRARNWIIGVVTAIWAINFLAGLVPQFNYEPDQAINGIFMAIVGGLFALGARGGGRSGPPEHKASPPPPHEEPPPPSGGGPGG
jgi:hypothetical protein